MREKEAGDENKQAVAARDHESAASIGAPNSAQKASPRQGSTMNSKALFAYVPRPQFADTIEAKLRAPAKEISYVELNRKLLEGKRSPLWLPKGQGSLSIPLPDGSTLEARIDNSTMLDASRFTSQGHIEGQPASRVLITGNADGQYSIAVLDVSVGEGEANRIAAFTLRATGESVAQFYEVDSSLMPPCGGSVHPVIDKKTAATIAARKAAASLAASGASETPSTANASDASSTPVVDLMMVYTPGVLASLSGDQTSRIAAIQSAFDLAVAETNTDFSRSSISASVRLVKMTSTTYNRAHVDETTLGAVQENADIASLRDEVGADGVIAPATKT
jgi:hypothetical protein